MAKITGELLYEIEGKVWHDALDAKWEECEEEVQEDYQEFAKRINDFLTYGHLPKKD